MPIPSDEGIPSLGGLTLVKLEGDNINHIAQCQMATVTNGSAVLPKGSEFPQGGEESKAPPRHHRLSTAMVLC